MLNVLKKKTIKDMDQAKSEKLNALKEKMAKDMSLPLRSGATNLVFGDGNSDSEILFIGEGPGYWEDIKGIPFVGNAGALLNQVLALINIKRTDVYITNVIHFRPPENRDPLPSEIESFQPYLDEIINIIQPKLIVTLGRYSMAKFLPGVTITSVHGKLKTTFWEGKHTAVLPMYHPAAALRSGEIKYKFVEDFKKIPAILEQVKTEIDKQPPNEETVEKVEQMNLL